MRERWKRWTVREVKEVFERMLSADKIKMRGTEEGGGGRRGRRCHI